MHRFSKTAPASFGQFWQFLKTVAENLVGAVFEDGASDRALSFETPLSCFVPLLACSA